MTTLTNEKDARLYRDGKREALRALYEDHFTLDGDADKVFAQVVNGMAPQVFKDGFTEAFLAIQATMAKTVLTAPAVTA